jgi:hypothetical protein
MNSAQRAADGCRAFSNRLDPLSNWRQKLRRVFWEDLDSLSVGRG